MTVSKEVLDALEFGLQTAENLYQPDKPLTKGLGDWFYHTLTYEGDLELIEKTKEMRRIFDKVKRDREGGSGGVGIQSSFINYLQHSDYAQRMAHTLDRIEHLLKEKLK